LPIASPALTGSARRRGGYGVVGLSHEFDGLIDGQEGLLRVFSLSLCAPEAFDYVDLLAGKVVELMNQMV
jgi:hypothetical protein